MKDSEQIWEEIHGFGSPGEYKRFVHWIEEQVRVGLAEEVQVDPDYGSGEIYDGRWFRNKSDGKVWRLVPPDFPFKGLWEPIRSEK